MGGSSASLLYSVIGCLSGIRGLKQESICLRVDIDSMCIVGRAGNRLVLYYVMQPHIYQFSYLAEILFISFSM